MSGRVIGGIAGWLIGVLPIAGLDAAEYFGLYLPNTELFGALAIVLGVILGGLVSGYFGGRASGPDRAGGAAGASITGAISALLYIVSTVALLLRASQGGMSPISSGQLLHVAAALLFFSALWLGIAMLTGFLTGKDAPPQEQESPPPYRQTSQPRYTEIGNSRQRSAGGVPTRQLETNDYNRPDRSRSSGHFGDYPDSGSPGRPRYPERERDPRLS